MIAGERDILLNRLDETRQEIENLLPKIDLAKEIYPGWTIKQLLAHITGWDDATIDSLREHVNGRPPSLPAIRSLDKYNDLTVSTRKDLGYDHILKEWRQTRQMLCNIIVDMPEDKFLEPVIVPWGKNATVANLVDMLRGHEEEHVQDINEWLKRSEKPLGKPGN